MTADLVITGGLVVDGTGGAPYPADVAVTDGRVSEIGHGLVGRRVLDAAGHVVAPGFIDIHTHYDAQVFWDPALTPSCFHGVTTVVAGNCGFSIAPTRPEHRGVIARTLENVEDMDVATLEAGIPWDFSDFPGYLDAVRRRGVGLNYTAYLGHTALRLYVMGMDAYERAATAPEIDAMCEVLRGALRAGAAGFATSFAPTHRGIDGKPVPSRHADRAEIDALLEVVRQERRGIVEFTPGEQLGIPDLYEIQPGVGVPFTYTALMTTPAGSHERLVALNRAGWAKGAQVWPQVSPRPLTFSFTLVEPFTLNSNPVFGELMAGGLEERRAAYADKDGFRARALAAWRQEGAFLVPRWSTYTVDESTAHPELIGRHLDAVAAERGADPFDVLLDLALDEPDLGLRMRCVLANDDVDALLGILTEEHCTLGLSDAGAHVGQLCDAPQATDFLGKWVRERDLMPIETAVRKLTGVQADLLGLTDRGYLRPGFWADIVVFDPATVAPGPVRRVRDFPADGERLTADQPTGVRHVLVNGTPIQIDGERSPNAGLPGQVLRIPTRD
ncbi:N-acyl-D-amino-acid deacylase family protein [Yinghuangia seranimata]|uniref:N-acyl-D-amino-acid deacylase family protein n=1 Tax=Yinghuangia seranimata TaxID=408067 RepID=UPI00248BA2BE|nr:amidohydrolase family protein [Yinghuangia seranimata]MDI2125175.1 amidohydrolase family protein [Yinghuangia seranimata]